MEMLPVRGSIGLAIGPCGCSVRDRMPGRCRSWSAAPSGRRCGECAGVASGV